MDVNIWIVPVAALIPMVIGALWYGPLFGKVWMKQTGVTKEKARESNMVVLLLTTYLLSCLLAFALMPIVIHQFGIFQAFQAQLESGNEAALPLLEEVMAMIGNDFRSFGHGALHGGIAGVTIAFVVLAVNARFEQKSWAYIGINAGYWIVSMILMGGLICQFA